MRDVTRCETAGAAMQIANRFEMQTSQSLEARLDEQEAREQLKPTVYRPSTRESMAQLPC
jgi:hypothetical protein